MRIFHACTRSQSDPNIQRSQPTPKIIKMLLRENLCRSHQGSLIAGLNRVEHNRSRNQSLTRSYISLQKSAHRNLPRHVASDLFYDTNLSSSRSVWKRIEKTLGQTTRRNMALATQSLDFEPSLFDHYLHRHSLSQS